MNHFIFRTAPAVTLALCLGIVANDAGACGGLFCSSSSPVNQAAERIVFAKNGNGTVTAAIEILYEGPSSSFAWLLPVPAAEVTVEVSSKQAFDALQQASNPSYGFQTTFATDCGLNGTATAAGSPVASTSPGVTPGPQGASPVQVVASGNVGPYDYVQIEVNPADEDPAQAAIDWLEEEGYDVGALGPEVLRPYLMQEMNLLAFRLNKDSDSGSIRPVMLTYPGERPLIPIRPTAVAANDDMGIMVWVLGSGRAVPTSYLHLELNEARIDWFNPNPTYNQLVSDAADEAGGNGFVTEQSGPAEPFAEVVFPQYKEDQFSQLRTAQFASIQEFLQQAQNVAQSHVFLQSSGFAGPLAPSSLSAQTQYDGFIEVLSDPDVVPLREGATAAQLNACLPCYFQVDVPVRNDLYPSTPYDPATDPILGMDVGMFLDEMEKMVIKPLRETGALFEKHRQVTRLYTTMSADEMQSDPEFDLNPELPDVSNVHTATRMFECNGNDWTITLPQGATVKGSGSTWPVTPNDEEMPFNWRILQLSTAGGGEVVLDNTDRVASRLVDLGLSDPPPMPQGPVGRGDGNGTNLSSSNDTGGGGCAVQGGKSSGGWAWGALTVFAGVVLSRRRARARA
jgi:hypothetical protein